MKLFTFFVTALLAPTLALAVGKIRIVNTDGQPVSGATVIIGNEVGDDTGRTLETDVNGFFEIPSDWKSLRPVSIRARNYIPTSFLMVEPQEVELQIHREDSKRYYEVKGNAVGFEDIKKDGKVDVALVYPALNRRELLQFDISSVISPETDKIKVITETVGIPSNLSLPKQQESYILPIKLDKPEYRMFVRKPGSYRVTANHGQFPLKRVIKDIQGGKSIFDVINHFKFKSAGQMEITVTEDMVGQDISVNQMKFDETVEMVAPTLPDKTGVVTAAMINQGGLFFPTDIKGLKSGETAKLNIPSGSNSSAHVLSLLTHEPEKSYFDGIDDAFGGKNDISNMLQFFAHSFDLNVDDTQPAQNTGVSLTFLPASTLVTPQFLDIVAEPVKLDDRRFAMNRPSALADVQPVATYLILSEVVSAAGGDNDFAAEKRFRIWESFQTGWPSEITLPNLNIQLEKGKKYRWEVMFLGRKADFNDNPAYFLDGITHVSRTSLDL